MRRLFAIVLALLFVAPAAQPLLAAVYGARAEADLPGCCRRLGQHHCAMTGGEHAADASSKPVLTTPASTCPYCYSSAVVAPVPVFTPRDVPATIATPVTTRRDTYVPAAPRTGRVPHRQPQRGPPAPYQA